MEKIKLRQAVIVEGKYDKIRLESVVDALILTTHGFRIYKDREQRALLQSLAKRCGLVVLTDSDSAGFQLRAFIKNLVPGCEVIHVYTPDIYGKERRKRGPSAEGKLGVEGMDTATLLLALRRAGVLESGDSPQGEAPPADPITRQDLYEDGLMGGPGSAEKRRALYRHLGLPQRLSTTAAIETMNHMITRQQYRQFIDSDGGVGEGEG